MAHIFGKFDIDRDVLGECGAHQLADAGNQIVDRDIGEREPLAERESEQPSHVRQAAVRLPGASIFCCGAPRFGPDQTLVDVAADEEMLLLGIRPHADPRQQHRMTVAMHGAAFEIARLTVTPCAPYLLPGIAEIGRVEDFLGAGSAPPGNAGLSLSPESEFEAGIVKVKRRPAAPRGSGCGTRRGRNCACRQAARPARRGAPQTRYSCPHARGARRPRARIRWR